MRKIIDLYNNCAKWLCSWRADRWLHFVVACVLCFAICALSSGIFGDDKGGAVATGAGITVLVCLAKEIMDTYGESGFDAFDLLFGFWGILLGVIFYAL